MELLTPEIEAEPRQDGLDDEKRSQLDAFRRWHREQYGARRRAADGPPPPRFSGDWSYVKWPAEELDLRGADFREVDSMERVDLKGADLRRARFDGVDLPAADLSGTRLDGAVFRDADLSDVHLDGAVGLSVEALGGADLRSARLPEDLGGFSQLEGVSEASKYVQGVYRLLLILCGFAVLTVMSFPDENFALRDGQSVTQLPLFQAGVSPQIFAYVVPGLVLLLYAYQVLYTASIWRRFSFLPARFPDGTPLDRRAYPSMTNIFVRCALRRIDRGRNDGMAYLIHWLVTYGIPPLTLGVIWLACLKKHDLLLSAYQALQVGLAVFILAFIFGLSRSVIRTAWKVEDLRFGQFLHDLPRCLVQVAAVAGVTMVWSFWPGVREWTGGTLPLLMTAAVLGLGVWDVGSRIAREEYAPATSSLLLHCLALAMAMHCVAMSAFGGQNHELKVIRIDETERGEALEFPARRASPLLWVLAHSEFNPFLDFRNKVLSRRPADWKGTGPAENDQIGLVVGADLEQADLRSVDAERAFLARANLRNADLRGAYFRFTYLREADLTGARLEGAYLRGANLRDAKLIGVDLSRVILSSDAGDPMKRIGPNLQGAKLDYRTMEPLDVEMLARQGAVNLPLAYFGITDADDALINGDLARAEGDLKAKANDPRPEVSGPASAALRHIPILQALKTQGLPRLTDTELNNRRSNGPETFSRSLPMTGADLSGYTLRGCTFDGVDLKGASFRGADLTGTSFRGADLSGVDFTGAELSGVVFGVDSKGARSTIANATFAGSTWGKATGLTDEQRRWLGASTGHPPDESP